MNFGSALSKGGSMHESSALMTSQLTYLVFLSNLSREYNLVIGLARP